MFFYFTTLQSVTVYLHRPGSVRTSARPQKRQGNATVGRKKGWWGGKPTPNLDFESLPNQAGTPTSTLKDTVLHRDKELEKLAGRPIGITRSTVSLYQGDKKKAMVP